MDKNHIGLYLKLHKENDKEVIKILQEQENKQGFIKELIRGKENNEEQDNNNSG